MYYSLRMLVMYWNLGEERIYLRFEVEVGRSTNYAFWLRNDKYYKWDLNLFEFVLYLKMEPSHAVDMAQDDGRVCSEN